MKTNILFKILYSKDEMVKIDKLILKKDVEFPLMKPILLKHKRGFFNKLKDFCTIKRQWQIKEDFCIWSPKLKKFIFIPYNFIFDGASVPKLLHWLYGSVGILFYGSIPHDFLYRYGGLVLANEQTSQLYFEPFTKSEADTIFKDICMIEQHKKIAISTAKIGLSLFGFLGWNQNRKKNSDLYEDFPEIFVKQ